MSNNQEKKILTFDTIKEEFTEGVFSNSNIICRTKQSLLNLELKKGPDAKSNVAVSFGNPLTFIGDFEEGIPGKLDSPKLEESDILHEIEFKHTKTPLNVYEILEVNKIIFTRLKFARIRKSKLFDTKGHRIYDIQILQDVGIFDGPPHNT